MKKIAFILSLSFLVLSLQPCSDGTNAEDLHQNEMSANHNHSEDSDDSCPITCICNCCGMAITYMPIKRLNINTLNLDQKISTKVFSNYQANYRFDFLSSIWQPPKLIS